MKFKSSNPAEAEVNMTPMIDIVFQLIAFFMVVINFEQTQADERVKLQRDGLVQPPSKPYEAQLTFNIAYERKNGKIIGKRENPFVLLSLTGGLKFYRSVNSKGEPVYLAKDKKGNKIDLSSELNKASRSLKRDKMLTKTHIIFRTDYLSPMGIQTELIKLTQTAGFEKFDLQAIQKIRRKKKK